MHDLDAELRALPRAATSEPARVLALRLESRQLFSIHRELLVVLYVAVAAVIAGVGWLVRANLERIGPISHIEIAGRVGKERQITVGRV